MNPSIVRNHISARTLPLPIALGLLLSIFRPVPVSAAPQHIEQSHNPKTATVQEIRVFKEPTALTPVQAALQVMQGTRQVVDEPSRVTAPVNGTPEFAKQLPKLISGDADWYRQRYNAQKAAERDGIPEKHNPWIDQFGNPISNRAAQSTKTVSNAMSLATTKTGERGNGDLVNPVPDGKAGPGGGSRPVDPHPEVGEGSGKPPLKLHPNVLKRFEVIDPVNRSRKTSGRKQ